MAATVGGKNSNERIETGWQRLKSVCMPRYGSGVPEELHDLPSSVIVASTVGFLAGGLYGTRTAADKFIAFNHFSKFTSTMQAQREMHAASMMGFLGTGCRWGWQLGAFAGLFTAARLLASIYRDRDDVINYVAAGSLTGGLFRVKYGLRATVGGAFVGTLVSLPLGAFMQGMEWLLIRGEQKETMALRRRTQRRRREEQWEERLKATDFIIEDLNNEDTHGSEHSGLRKHYSLHANKIAVKSGGDKNS